VDEQSGETEEEEVVSEEIDQSVSCSQLIKLTAKTNGTRIQAAKQQNNCLPT